MAVDYKAPIKDILFASTGVIGERFPVDQINESVQTLTTLGWGAVDFNDAAFTIGSSSEDGFADTNIAEIIIIKSSVRLTKTSILTYIPCIRIIICVFNQPTTKIMIWFKSLSLIHI